MTSVTAIATEAFDAVAAKFSDGIIQTASLSYEAPLSSGEVYDAKGGKFLTTPTTPPSGRAVIGTASAIANKFPAHTIGADDTLIMLEGFTTVPKVGWKVTVGTKVRTIKAVGDIVDAGTFFEVVAA